MRLSNFVPGRLYPALTRQLYAGETPKRIFVIANPATPKLYDALRLIMRTADQLGLVTPNILTTTRRSPGRLQAKLAVEAGADLVIAAGGDGTMRLVAGELADSNATLGVIPIGAGNIFARNLTYHRLRNHFHLPPLISWVRSALSGSVAEVDLGQVTLWRADGTVMPPEPMLTMTGVGRDAQAVAQVSRHLKNSLGWMAYLPAAIRKSFATPYQFTVSSAGEIPQNITAWSVLIANCPLVPLRVMAFPNAVLDDGLFDRLDVSVNRAWQWGAVAAKGLINCAATPAVLRYRQVKDLTIRTPCPLPVQVDGDIIEDVNQLQVVVSPGALRVRVPANEN